MKQLVCHGIIATGCMLLARTAMSPAFAATGTSNDHWETSARASTLGAGVEVKRTLGANTAARAMLNGFSLSLDEEYSDVAYDGDLSLKSGGVILTTTLMAAGFACRQGFCSTAIGSKWMRSPRQALSSSMTSPTRSRRWEPQRVKQTSTALHLTSVSALQSPRMRMADYPSVAI